VKPGYLINILLAVALSVLSAAPPAADEPLGPGRRVVIFGSSTAAGIGASHYARSWAGRLTSELQLRGYRVFNRSISGNNTRDLLARFDTDVTPLQPEFVVFASSMQNESITTDPRGAYARYTTNLALLLEKAQRIGANSVVIGQYANNGYSGEAVDVVQRVYEDLERQGIATWEVFGPTADPITGKWLPDLSDDGVHPNDPGHKLIFDSIPLAHFQTPRRDSRTAGAGACWQWGRDLTNIPMRVKLDRPVSSWTAAAWVRGTGGAGKVLIGLDGDPNLCRFILRDNELAVVSGTNQFITANWPGGAMEWRHAALSYRYTTNTMDLYLDGLRVATGAMPYRFEVRAFHFLSRSDTTAFNCDECGIAMPLLYRGNLKSGDIRQLMQGRVLGKSLEFSGDPGRVSEAGARETGASTVTEAYLPSWSVEDSSEVSPAKARPRFCPGLNQPF
jgi:lysophospholipase L1-like esterase